MIAKRLWLFLGFAGISTLGIPFAAHAAPESTGNWFPYFAPALGLAPDNLPDSVDFTDELIGTVAAPSRLAAYGMSDLKRGDQVILTSLFNGYWVVTHKADGHQMKLPIGWTLRFGIKPDRELTDGKVPEKITGVVVDPAVLAQYRFATARSAKRFTLVFEGGSWVLTIEPSGEKNKVPL